METLIANSGLQFYSQKVELNISEPCMLKSGKTLKYSFVESEDIITETRVFDLLCTHSSGALIPYKEIKDAEVQTIKPDNNDELDEAGCIKMKPDAEIQLFSTYSPGQPEVISINSLEALRVRQADHQQVSAFSLLVNHWLPMPFFEKPQGDVCLSYPTGWARMKLIPLGKGVNKNSEAFRIVWAFDTTTGDFLSDLRPMFDENETEKQFCLCNRADLLLNFMFTEDGKLSPFAVYISSILGLDVDNMLKNRQPQVFKFVAYYIYLVNYIRISGFAPEITLYNDPDKSIPVDLVLDIGNSRTCGVLFEEGDSCRAIMLELRDMSRPWVTYRDPFDMRICFRQADFGNGIILDEDMFQWRSLVRLGNEARSLIYRSIEDVGLSEETTNYSSPKRYLWDEKPFDGVWKNMTTVDDPYNVRSNQSVFLKGLSENFDSDGSYKPDEFNSIETNYSRSSLMTFVMVEIFNQAFMQINSISYRSPLHGWGRVDCSRYLRNIVITCPTAMPRREQIRLRQAAVDAFDVLQRANPSLKPVTISPSPESLKINDDFAEPGMRQWGYDEASCSQLVYLYAELSQRYDGEASRFFESKGHVRPEFVEEGYTQKALTIGSVDIGAGTTDLMICSYQQSGKGKIVPVPKFWDSFYLAGDDILKNIVQNVILDGPMRGSKTEGSIASVTLARLQEMTNDELRQLNVYTDPDQPIYRAKIDSIARIIIPAQREAAIKELSINLVRGIFGRDASYLSARERRCRVDFNTQVSVPIAQKFMGLVAAGQSPRRFTFEELFKDIKPADYLLDFFEEHFGYRFEELIWDFDPEQINKEVRHTMEALMKQLSIVLSAYHCDIVVLSGRPTSLPALPELFIKHYPVTPERLVRLNKYRVGTWYPFADPDGDFNDHKSVVAVGAMVGFLSSTQGFNGMALDFSRMIKMMKPTSNYIGIYKSLRQRVDPTLLTPNKTSASFDLNVFPAALGCRQLDSVGYQARPLYAIYNYSNSPSLRITISRFYRDDRELIMLDEVTDDQGNDIPRQQIELVPQSLVDDGKYWLDKGEFELSLK